MSTPIAVAAGALVVLLSTAPAEAADVPTLFVFHAPADAPPESMAARDELIRVAQARGAPVVDVSPPAATAPQAPLQLRRAYEAYHDFKYADALSSLEAALAEASATGADGLTSGELSDLFLYRALIASEQGNGTAAWEDFVRAAAVDPTRKLDPVRFPPRIVEEFARAVAAVGKAHGALTVEVATGCKVVVDARPVDAGRPIDITTGEHFLRVTCASKLPHASVVVVRESGARVAPVMREPEPPVLADAIAIAARRGAGRLVWAVATGPAERAPTLLLVVADVSTKAEVRRRVIALDRGGARSIAGAVDELLPSLGAATPDGTGGRGRDRWYTSPWLWGGVGAAVAAAVLLPFVFDGGGSGFGVELDGAFRR